MEKSRVIPVTSAKPFLEEKLRRMGLQLANLQDCADSAVTERASRRAVLLKENVDASNKDFKNLGKEFKKVFRDFSGYDNPPVLPALPIFDEFSESEKITASEEQYVLGSLTLEEGEVNPAIEWCLKAHHLGVSLLQMEETAEELKKETTLRDWEAELVQKEKRLEDQESRTKKILNEREAALNHREKILEKTLKDREKLLEKTFSEREKILEDGKKHQQKIRAEIEDEQQKLFETAEKLEEQQKRLEKRETHTEQLREGLPEQRVNLRGQEDRLRQREKQLQDKEKQLEEQLHKYQRLCEQMDQNYTEESPSPMSSSISAVEHDPNDIFASIPDEMEGGSQSELIQYLQQERVRMDQDKNWVKSLLKTLLDQQEKIQTVQENVREAERSSIRSQTENLRQERGWIKVEKSKIRKAGVHDEEIEISME